MEDNRNSLGGPKFPSFLPPLSLYLHIGLGGAFLLTFGAFLLTVKLLCLQSLKALIRCTFPL